MMRSHLGGSPSQRREMGGVGGDVFFFPSSAPGSNLAAFRLVYPQKAWVPPGRVVDQGSASQDSEYDMPLARIPRGNGAVRGV